MVNNSTPTIVNGNFKVGDHRKTHFGEVKIVVDAVIVRGGDGIGEVEDQAATFTEGCRVWIWTEARIRVVTAIKC